MKVSASVNVIRARSGAHVPVRTTVGPLRGIVHRSIHAKFLNRFRGGGGNGFSDCQIDGGGALDWNRAQVAGLAYAGVVHDSGGVYLAGAFTVKDVAGIHAIQQKTITGIALSVGPYGLIT